MTGALTLDGREQVGPRKRRVAQYLRTSASHQRYSMQNQRDTICTYAAEHGMALVKTYTDGAKSGLTRHGRRGLQELLEDVCSGAADYEAILVYDISRWGRFQDIDESAACEFMCRQAGIEVIYCEEPFAKTDDMAGDLMKWVKRAMAGESSRETGQKAHRAHCRLARLGYHQGAPATYGLRRLCQNESGEPKLIMQRGESKVLKTDRVVLVSGPAEEQKIVRLIFSRFANQRRSMEEIAVELNSKGVPNALGRSWRAASICRMLHNERYTGTFLWNQKQSKLKTPRRCNDPQLWIRLENAIEPIVPKALWERAQRRLASFTEHSSYDQMIRGLRKILREKGRLTSALIEEAALPSPTSYRRRFGSLERAYRAIGYVHGTNAGWHESHTRNSVLRSRVTAELLRQLNAYGHILHSCGRLIRVDHGLRLAVVTANWQRMRSGNERWVIHRQGYKDADLLLAVRPNPTGTDVLDYYLLPNRDKMVRYTNVGTPRTSKWESYRVKTLEPLIDVINLSSGDAERFISDLTRSANDKGKLASG